MDYNHTFFLKPQTVKLIKRLIAPLMDYGLVSNTEYNTIITHLSYLAKHGKPMPTIMPRLINTEEAAKMLGICSSQFRALEKEGTFPFKRRSVGNKTVRYKNTDIIEYMDVCGVTQDGQPDSAILREQSLSLSN